MVMLKGNSIITQLHREINGGLNAIVTGLYSSWGIGLLPPVVACRQKTQIAAACLLNLPIHHPHRTLHQCINQPPHLAGRTTTVESPR